MARRLTERAHDAVGLVQENPIRFADQVFFFIGTLASGWLAFLLVYELFTAGWRHLWAFIPFWLLVTYLLLPRIHSLLARVYVPDYFIGRSRTREGLVGDPVNVGVRGSLEQLHTAMLRAGWRRAEEINLESARRMVLATLLRRSYPDAPVSPLFLFRQRQAFTYQQQVEGNPAQRHHVRFWACPPGWRLPGGKRVDWLAAGTYDRSVGLSRFTLQVTHRIDADIDAERDHILRTLTRPAGGNRGARVRHLRNFSTGYHDRNGGGDTIRTDGDLPIVDLRATPPATPGIRETIAAADAQNQRRNALPLTVALGLFLMLLRVAVGALSLAWLVNLSRVGISDLEIVAPFRTLGVPPGVVSLGVRVVLVAYLLAYLLLAALIYRRSNRARMLTLTLSVISVVTYVVLWITGAPSSTLATQVFGSGLEVLVLLALTGQTARLFTTRAFPKRTAQRPSS